MLSKSMARATTVTGLLLSLAGCARLVPWRNEPIGQEVNFAFTLEDNLVELQTLRVDRREGRYLLGTAAPRTIVDDGFVLRGRRHAVQIGDKTSLRINPERLDLGGVADAIIGADAWSRNAVTIDYRLGLVTYQKEGIHPEQMTLFPFRGAPTVTVSVDGRDVVAVVDTTSPDTLVLPRATVGRGTVRVVLAGLDLGPTDVQYANVSRARIGNRLLSRFLVTIDYGRTVVGLWADPRIEPPLSAKNVQTAPSASTAPKMITFGSAHFRATSSTNPAKIAHRPHVDALNSTRSSAFAALM